jgi:blue copper oxidase
MRGSDVTTELVRLRLLNGSTARTYDFGFADDRRFDLIGTDGGLVAEPHATARVLLSPGERAEIVVRMQPGEQAVLRSFPPRLGIDHPGGVRGWTRARRPASEALSSTGRASTASGWT